MKRRASVDNKLTKNRFLIISCTVIMILNGCSTSMKSEKKMLLKEIEFSLKNEFIDLWYPASLDSVYGGFLSDFTFDWQPQGPQHKMIVTQSRQIWTATQCALFYNDDYYRRIAAHGLHFLRDKIWDTKYGGFYHIRDQQGNALPGDDADQKSAYGNAFALYALATHYAVFGDSAVLDLACQTFNWLEKYNHDPEYKGYVDVTDRTGNWLQQNTNGIRIGNLDGGVIKDFNSSIHILEALTQFYKVRPDSLVWERLQEMLILIRDFMIDERGFLKLYFERDWTPFTVDDSADTTRPADYSLAHVSFGHDVETAYLMLEADQALGTHSNPQIRSIAKKIVDHTLANGWDQSNGGFYYQGNYFANSDTITVIDNTKEWWVQAEGLNALLLMAKLFPEENKYYESFKRQWEYLQRYLIDHEHGGWYSKGLDKSPERLKSPKGSIWKVNYHETRAMINCIKLLQNEHELLK